MTKHYGHAGRHPPARPARTDDRAGAGRPHDRGARGRDLRVPRARTVPARAPRSACSSGSSIRHVGERPRPRPRHRPRLRRDPTPGRLSARRCVVLGRPVRGPTAGRTGGDVRPAAGPPRRAARPPGIEPSGRCGDRSATTRAGCARRSASSRRCSTTRSWPSSTSRPKASIHSCSASFYEILDDLRAAGRTIFFSSHVLSEVERVCDRVAIIRQGRLVALEDVPSLLARRKRNVEIRLAGPAPVLDGVAGRLRRPRRRLRSSPAASRATSGRSSPRSPVRPSTT